MYDVKVEEVLDKIEEQSEFYFLYNQKLLDTNRKISINVSGKTIKEVLNILFDDAQVHYAVYDRQIIMSPAGMLDVSEQQGQAMRQQGIIISGMVNDETGESIPGVNVTVKGTLIGVVTGIDGRYSITVSNADAVLVFSFVGFVTQEIAVGDQRAINVTLNEDSRQIEEVVVVGYGVQKKVNVIGSISQITSDNLDGRATPLLSNALAGQMPGVTVIQRSGRPGMSTGELCIRGVGSFGASPEALILIDGIPGGINDVSPEEVASISVLKDASSPAIYGARAANGVVLITTKSAKENKIAVNYNGYRGLVKAIALPEFFTIMGICRGL
jgi:TonB-dependent SusC/RagA subfamily outer membrane receptor